MDAGDTVLMDYMGGPSKNARYISISIENELILLSLHEEVMRDTITKAANESNGFFNIADKLLTYRAPSNCPLEYDLLQ